MEGSNTPAYYNTVTITASKSFIVQGANVIKLFYGRKLRIFVISRPFVPGKPFHLCGKAGAYLSEAPIRCSTLR
jgi:hypothetical protein